MNREADSAPTLWGVLKSILTDGEQRAFKSALGMPQEWEPPTEARRQTMPQQLEGFSELDRIMRQPPGRIGQLKEEFIQRVDPEPEKEPE